MKLLRILNFKMTNYLMDMTVWAVFTSWMVQHAAQGKRRQSPSGPRGGSMNEGGGYVFCY